MEFSRLRRFSTLSIQKYLRLAVLEDIPTLLNFARNFHRSSYYKSMKFDRIKGEKFLRHIISGSTMDGVVLVALQDDKPIGFLVGMANEPVFSSAKIATELGWWIEPES